MSADPLLEKLLGTRRKVFPKTIAPPPQMGAFYATEAKGLAQFRNLQRAFRTELRRTYRQYQETRDIRAFKQRARELFHVFYAKAFQLGNTSALGMKRLLSTADREWIQKSARQESSYWNDFVNDVHLNRTGRLSPLARIDNYVASLEAIFHAGKVVNLPQRMAIDWLVNPVAEHCTTPDVRLLMRDLRWVPCMDVNVGDQIIAFDEEGKRRWRSAIILAKEVVVADVFEVKLSSGEKIFTTAEHRWLAYGNSPRIRRAKQQMGWGWVRTDQLVPKKRIGSRGFPGKAIKLTRVIPVVERSNEFEVGWLAGLLDGEGTLTKEHTRISFGQNPGIVLDRALDVLSRLGYSYGIRLTNTERHTGLGKKICHTVGINGRLADRLAFLSLVRPERLIAKLDPDTFGKLEAWGEPVTVVSVIPSGRSEIVKLTTSSATLVMEGFPMHNCKGCLWLEKNGPYVKENLPTTPGAGATSCRHNCRCELNYHPVPQRLYDVYRSKQNARQILQILARLK